MIDEILARQDHPAFGWRPSDYEPSRAYQWVSREEFAFYVRCHVFLSSVGHPLTEDHLRLAESRSGTCAEDVVLTSEDRRSAIIWHIRVRPWVAGEGWNRHG